jgi:hypothetical protein
MKKVLLAVALFIAVSGLNAQDLKTAKKLLEKNDISGAKTQIDGFLAANPDNAEGLYLKGKIYEAIANDSKLQATVPGAVNTAFEALKKAYDRADTDPELLKLKVTDKNFYKPLVSLYTDYYNLGQAAFRNGVASQQTSDFESAMNNFIGAESVGKYINTSKIAVLPGLDTVIVLNIGQSAINAQKEDVALAYFKRIADADVKGRGFELPYEWLTQYYFDKKDNENFKKYANKGKQFFPNDTFFSLILVDYYEMKKDAPNLAKTYEDLILSFPDSSMYHLYYASFLLNELYKDTSAHKAVLQTKFENEIKIPFKKDPNDINANSLYGQYYYIVASDYQNQAKMIKDPKNVKLKEEKTKASKDHSTQALPYLEKAVSLYEVNSLKADKSKYKTIVNQLIELYTYLGQNDKAKAYQQKYDDADKKFTK